MRLLHTADWHLGFSLREHAFLDEQAHLLLEQFVPMVRDARPDAVLLAGDVFHRAIAPVEALALFDEIAGRIVGALGVPMVVIAGNHDAPERLAAHARLLAGSGLYVVGGALSDPILLHDAHGAVAICPTAYAGPARAAEALGEPGVATHDAAMAAICARLAAAVPTGARSVLVGHAFVAGGTVGEVERELMVGGSGQVAARHFAPFAYAALGHLHRPQDISPTIAYAGAPMPYAFDEAGQAKSARLVEIAADGSIATERLPFSPRRPMRILRGDFATLLAAPADAADADWLKVELTDAQPVLSPAARLRARYPNLVELAVLAHRAVPSAAVPLPRDETATPLGLFKAFYAHVHGTPPQPGHEAAAALAITAAQDSA